MSPQLKLFTNDWQRLPGHLDFLLTFLLPRQRDKHPIDIDWSSELGEPAARAVDRFIAMGAVQHATNVAIALDEKYTAAELRDMLQQAGNSQRGKKSGLILRLLRVDYSAMEKATIDVRLLHCSETGERIARQYVQLLSDLQGIEGPTEYAIALRAALSQVPVTTTTQDDDRRDVTNPETQASEIERDTSLLQTSKKVLKWLTATWLSKKVIAPEVVGSATYEVLNQLAELSGESVSGAFSVLDSKRVS